MLLRPEVTAAFLVAKGLADYSRLVAFQCSLVSWDSIDSSEEPLPEIPAGIPAPEASLQGAIWAYRAYILSKIWQGTQASETAGTSETSLRAAELCRRCLAGPSEVTAAVSYFRRSIRCIGPNVCVGLALMSWPVSAEHLAGATQLAAAAQSALWTQSVAEHQQRQKDQAAAEQKADAMASLLIQEEAAAASKAQRKASKARKQRSSGKPAQKKNSQAKAAHDSEQQGHAAVGSGGSDGSASHQPEHESLEAATAAASIAEAGPAEPQGSMPAVAAMPDAGCAGSSEQCSPETAPQAAGPMHANQSHPPAGAAAPSSLPDSSPAESLLECSPGNRHQADQHAGAGGTRPLPQGSAACSRPDSILSAAEQQQGSATAPSTEMQKNRTAADCCSTSPCTTCAGSHDLVSRTAASSTSHALRSASQELLPSQSMQPESGPTRPCAASAGPQANHAETCQSKAGRSDQGWRPVHDRATRASHAAPCNAPQQVQMRHPSHAQQRLSPGRGSRALNDVTATSLNAAQDSSGSCHPTHAHAWEAQDLQKALQDALGSRNCGALEAASHRAVKWLGRVGVNNPAASQVCLLFHLNSSLIRTVHPMQCNSLSELSLGHQPAQKAAHDSNDLQMHAFLGTVQYAALPVREALPMCRQMNFQIHLDLLFACWASSCRSASSSWLCHSQTCNVHVEDVAACSFQMLSWIVMCLHGSVARHAYRWAPSVRVICHAMALLNKDVTSLLWNQAFCSPCCRDVLALWRDHISILACCS